MEFTFHISTLILMGLGCFFAGLVVMAEFCTIR